VKELGEDSKQIPTDLHDGPTWEDLEIETDGIEMQIIEEFQASGPAVKKSGPFGSDTSYTDALVKEYKDKIRFIPEEGGWLIFDSRTGWHRDTSGEVLSLASDFARAQIRAVQKHAKTLSDPRLAGAMIANASKLGNMARITPAIDLAKVHRDLIIPISQLDREPYLLGTTNGIVDLRDGSFRPHSPEIFVTRSVSCHFNPDAQCPTFFEFLEVVQPDPEMRAFLQRLCGYALTGYMGEHILPFHYGMGANGKGTFLEQTLLKIMGTYGAKVTDNLVYQNSRGAIPDLEIAGLCGIRFALGEENEAGGNLNERLLKSITGGDRQKGRFLYKPFFEFEPTAKIHLVGNHRPRITGRDDGIWRRFRLLDWAVQIPGERQDRSLAARLEPEFPGILNWMIQGELERVRRGGTCPPDSVLAATTRFREDSDSFGDFLRECTVDDPSDEISKRELFRLYGEYCEDQNIQPRFRLTKRYFGNRVADRGYEERRSTAGEHVWVGLRDRTPDDDLTATPAPPATVA